MMKTTHAALVAAVLLAALPFRGLASQTAQDAGADLTELEAQVEELAAQATEHASQIARLENALTKVAQSAEAMSKTLDEAETLGFTAGINPNSRHTLLAGWRKQLATLKAFAKKPGEETSTARRSR